MAREPLAKLLTGHHNFTGPRRARNVGKLATKRLVRFDQPDGRLTGSSSANASISSKKAVRAARLGDRCRARAFRPVEPRPALHLLGALHNQGRWVRFL